MNDASANSRPFAELCKRELAETDKLCKAISTSGAAEKGESEFRSCVKVEVAVLGFSVLMSLTV